MALEEQDEAALARQLWAERKDIAEIARELGISTTAVWRHVSATAGAASSPDARELWTQRAILLDRLDLLVTVLMPLVKEASLPAVDKLLAIEKLRMDLLGLKESGSANTEPDSAAARQELRAALLRRLEGRVTSDE